MRELSGFHKAVAKNRVSQVKRLLKQGESVDPLGFALAIQNNAHDVLKILIRTGADPDKKEAYWGYTPLVRSLREKNIIAFRMLLKAGAQVDKRGPLKAPLHCAAEDGLLDFTKLCISSGADIELRDGSGNTPLMLAASMGRLDVVKLLIKAGANARALNWADRTSCQLAAENNETEIVQLLEPISQRKPPRKRGVAALLQAVERQDLKAVDKLLAKGIDVNESDRFKRSPFWKAISIGAVPLVKRLIAAGVQINRIEPGGVSFLLSAIRAEKPVIVQILLKAGAIPKAVAENDPDPLWEVCTMGNVELARSLLKHGAAPNCASRAGETALMKAVGLWGSALLVELLLSNGADLERTDDNGWTALFHAVQPAVTFIETKFASGARVLAAEVPKSADDGRQTGIVKCLLKFGSIPNRQDKEGRTPVTFVIRPEIAQLLLGAGARLDILDRDGHDVCYWLRKNGLAVNTSSSGVQVVRRPRPNRR